MGDIKKLSELLGEKEKIQTFDQNGRIYIPKEYREKLKDHYFYIMMRGETIVLKPLKID